jgi:hypothetical protein
MFDNETLYKVRAEVCRLHRELDCIKEQDESLKIRRGRLEESIAKAESFLTMLETAKHFRDLPDDPDAPEFSIETLECGAKMVVPAVQDSRADAAINTDARAKPDGIPTMAEMAREAIAEAGYPCRPNEVFAYIRAKWWWDVKPAVVKTTLWKMAKAGELRNYDGRYGILRPVNGRANGYDSSDSPDANTNP